MLDWRTPQDKVNLTIAILPIAHEFGWSSTVSGLVQSSFFWGFLIAQMPGGSLSSRAGGSRMLPTAVGVWSAATALLPFAATSMSALCMSRVAVGLGEALAPSAIIDMLARTIPAEKRAGAVSTAFSGLHFGSIIGLIVTPHVIDMFGWRSVFFLYGALGVGWIVGFNMLLEHIAEREPEVARLLKPGGDAALSAANSSGKAACSSAGVQSGVPYRAMLRSRPVQALMLTHFAHNWFQYTMLAWLPAYFTDTLQVDLMHAAQTALLPPLAGILASQLAGRGADFLIGNGMPLPGVRKAAQCIAFLGPAALLSLLTFNDELSSSAGLTIACVTGALGLSSFSLAGLYCTHQDLSPKYASAMLGLTNVSGSVPGIVGVALTGFLLDNTGGSWELALFAPSILWLTAGAVVYTSLGKNDPINLDAAGNHPFAWEERLSGLHRGWSALSRSAGKLSALARRE